MVMVGVVIVLSVLVRAHGVAQPYQSRTVGSAGTPVYGPVTYASFVRHELKKGRCTISEVLEAGAELEKGLINSRLLYGHFSMPPAGPAAFEIAADFAADCQAAAADPYVAPGLLSETFRDAFRHSGHLLSTRLAMANVYEGHVESGFILIDAERRTAFRLLPGPESITVAPLERYPDEFRLEVYLADLGWSLLWRRDSRFRLERNQKPIALALPWWRLTIELEVPIFLPHYENRLTDLEDLADEGEGLRADYVYHAGSDLLEPDGDSHVLFDMPAGTVLSSFPPGQVVPAPESGRMRWRVRVGRSGMELSEKSGEAGLVRMKLLNARLARIGLGPLAVRRPSALVCAALGVVAGSYAKKVLDLVLEPAAKVLASWLTSVIR
jgi:hypothetical protein